MKILLVVLRTYKKCQFKNYVYWLKTLPTALFFFLDYIHIELFFKTKKVNEKKFIIFAKMIGFLSKSFHQSLLTIYTTFISNFMEMRPDFVYFFEILLLVPHVPQYDYNGFLINRPGLQNLLQSINYLEHYIDFSTDAQ